MKQIKINVAHLNFLFLPFSHLVTVFIVTMTRTFIQGRTQRIFWWGAQGITTINLGGPPKCNKNESRPLQYGQSLQFILNSYTLFSSCFSWPH